MELIADALLMAGTLGAAIYCFVLSRRLKKFNNLQNGMGGAVAVLSAQVDDMTILLERAQSAAGKSADQLSDLTQRAEAASRKLELMMASLHDLPDEKLAPAPPLTTTGDTPAPPHAPAENMPTDLPVFLSNRHKHLEAAE